jgi:predicted metal-dependent phosphoesterase TrpH
MVHCRPLTESGAATPIAVTERIARFGPADSEPFPYAVVPFDVPPGTRALRVSLAYDAPATSSDPGHGNILDLGILAPGSTAVGTAAFRGWSGSERSLVIVGEAAATPGYRPGPIVPGTWHVLLGLYRIVEAGCEARLRVEALADEPPIPGGVSSRVAGGRALAAATMQGPGTSSDRWIAADLHSHTLHSDGVETIAALSRRARAAGIEALFVTDHNTDAHLPELDAVASPSLLPGEEVTTYRGHLNALGTGRWVEFRYATARGVAGAIAEIHAQGGLASVNHPTSVDIPWRHGSDLEFDCVEVWNGPWSAEDDAALDWWEAILGTGRRVTAIGGSDTHGPGPDEQPVGRPTTWILASDLTLPTLLGAVRGGRVVLTRDAATPPPTVRLETVDRRAGIGERMRLETRRANGLVVRWALAPIDGGHRGPDGRPRVSVIVDGAIRHDVAAGDAMEGAWPVPEGEPVSRIRLEVRADDGGLLAVTNPVYVEGPGR